MHLVHSAIRLITGNQQSPSAQIAKQMDHETAVRYRAYQTVCNKYSQEIAGIQKYLPGWRPKPPAY